LAPLAKFNFPVNLNATTRKTFEHTAELETPETAADIRSVLSASPNPLTRRVRQAHRGRNEKWAKVIRVVNIKAD
jgi:hypothetical protein